MSEHLLDHFQVRVRGQGEDGGAVPQVVQPDRGQAELLADLAEPVGEVMRGAVKLSPAAVLLAALIGGAALGLIGALMAIPVAAGATVLLSERLRPATRPTAIPLVKAAGVMTNVSHRPTRPARDNIESMFSERDPDLARARAHGQARPSPSLEGQGSRHGTALTRR
jgi:hypothetical protein